MTLKFLYALLVTQAMYWLGWLFGHLYTKRKLKKQFAEERKNFGIRLGKQRLVKIENRKLIFEYCVLSLEGWSGEMLWQEGATYDLSTSVRLIGLPEPNKEPSELHFN